MANILKQTFSQCYYCLPNFFLSFFKSVYYLNVDISVMRRPLSKDSLSYCTAPHGSLLPHHWHISFGSKQPNRNVKIFSPDSHYCEMGHIVVTQHVSPLGKRYLRGSGMRLLNSLYLFLYLFSPTISLASIR